MSLSIPHATDSTAAHLSAPHLSAQADVKAARLVQVYFANSALPDLFQCSQLADDIGSFSDGKFQVAFDPEEQSENRDFRTRMEMKLRNVLGADVCVVHLNTKELASDTAALLMAAKMADIPTLIVNWNSVGFWGSTAVDSLSFLHSLGPKS